MEGQKEQTRQKEHVRLEFESNSRNEEFARVVAAVFMSRLDPTLEETQDVKTAVSEAVTNAIIHGYGKEGGEIFLDMTADPAEKTLTVCVTDTGAGIQDVKKAMEPLYTTDTTGERSGMGFSFMEWIIDNIFTPFIDGFKAAFGIHSPSTVMADMGGYLMEGLINGIKDGWNNIKESVGTVAQSVIDKFKDMEYWSKMVSDIKHMAIAWRTKDKER